MRGIFRLSGALLALLATPAAAEETIRIALEEKAQSLVLQGERLWQSAPGEEPSWEEVPGGTAQVAWKQGKLWLNAKPVKGAGLVLAAGRRRGATGELPIEHAGVAFRGHIEVWGSQEGLSAINVLPLESYLLGVLGKEMPKSFPMEALKAQAVAARTYALQKKLQRLGEQHHLGASVLHQVYGGMASEEARTRAAVEATRGQVLLFEREAVEAYFHASCGGQTETGKEALTRELPYLAAQTCPCKGTKAARWQAQLSEAELKKAFGVAEGRLAPGPKTTTGRYKTLRVGDKNILAAEFRRRLGSTRIRSLKFRIGKEKAGGYRLEGEGYGHGAGLCQWGAKGLAEGGKSYTDILQHYYAGSQLMRLY